MVEDDMCPNCVTPWKCNGPHEHTPTGVPIPARPLEMPVEQWMDCLAHAWDLGWEACSNYVQDGDCDPKFWNVWHDNPYRIERTEAS